MTGRFDDVIERIEAIADELDQLSFDLLREAVADGATARPTTDRRLMQARRALDKAAQTLAQLDGNAADESERSVRHAVNEAD